MLSVKNLSALGISIVNLAGNLVTVPKGLPSGHSDNQGSLQMFVFGMAHCQLSMLPSPKKIELLENVSELIWLFVLFPLGSINILTTKEHFCHQTGLPAWHNVCWSLC